MSRDLIEHAKHFKTTFKEHSEAYRLRVLQQLFPLQRCLYPHGELSCGHAFRFFYREMTGNEVIEDVYTNRADDRILSCIRPIKQTRSRELLAFRHLEARPLFQSRHTVFLPGRTSDSKGTG